MNGKIWRLSSITASGGDFTGYTAKAAAGQVSLSLPADVQDAPKSDHITHRCVGWGKGRAGEETGEGGCGKAAWKVKCLLR